MSSCVWGVYPAPPRLGVRGGLEGIQVGPGTGGLEMASEAVVHLAKAEAAQEQRPPQDGSSFEQVATAEAGRFGFHLDTIAMGDGEGKRV